MTPHLPDTCIIGAGWSGLLACKAMKERGFHPVVLERAPYFGGVWRHDPTRRAGGVMRSTITTSSKGITEMSDFPMPGDFPAFPRHDQIFAYLESYVAHFDLRPHLRLGAGAARVEKVGGRWHVTDSTGTVHRVDRVIVCSGVHQEPADSGRASVAGFTGRVVHSVEVARDLEMCAGQRVLMVGAGETASDLASELTRLTPHLTVSSRTGQWFASRVSSAPLPVPSLNDYFSSPIRMIFDPTDDAVFTARALEDRYGKSGSGVPEWQAQRPFQAQFLNKNTALVELWRLGQVKARPAITGAEGGHVTFRDGRREAFDIIVLCTGFETVFPFLPAPYDTARIDTHFKMLLADDPTLSFVGFVRPVVGSIPAIAELQSRCLAALYAGAIPLPADRARIIARDQATARRRFDDARIAGLVDMTLYNRSLATWLGVQPDYAELLRTSPRRWWKAIFAPHNGAIYRLEGASDADADAIVDHMDAPCYLFKKNLSAWAWVLLVNAFPVRMPHVYTERRGRLWRAAVGVLLAPLTLLTTLLAVRGRSMPGQLVGGLVLAVLSPVWITRLLRSRATHRSLVAQFQGRPLGPARAGEPDWAAAAK